jgi:hypothetical protein
MFRLNKGPAAPEQPQGPVREALKPPETLFSVLQKETAYEIHKIDRASAYDFARLAIGSLIATSAGSLVAFLAFLGQRKDLSAPMLGDGLWALDWLGAALLLALGAAIFAYFSLADLAFWGAKRRPWWARASVVACLLSLLASAGGAWLALSTVGAALTPNVASDTQTNPPAQGIPAPFASPSPVFRHSWRRHHAWRY